MFPEAILIGVLTGWIRRGQLRRLGEVGLTGFWLALGALLIQAALWLDFYTLRCLVPFVPLLHFCSYLLLLGFVFLNRRHRGMLLFCLGLLLNLAVIGSNGGKMPVDPDRLSPSHQEKLARGMASPVHTALDEKTRLAFLADVFFLPYGKNKLISLGDIALAAGLILFIQAGMQASSRPEKRKAELL